MDKQQELSIDDRRQAQRAVIRLSLDEIANDVGIPLRDAGLNFALGLIVPDSGEALVTVATPVDPSDDDWSKTLAIVYQVVGRKLGGIRLRSRPLQCVMVNATMSAADLAAE